MDLTTSLEKRICVWDYKPRQRPVAGEIVGPTGEDTAIISLSECDATMKRPLKHPYIIVAVSFDHGGKSDFAISFCYHNPKLVKPLKLQLSGPMLSHNYK